MVDVKKNQGIIIMRNIDNKIMKMWLIIMLKRNSLLILLMMSLELEIILKNILRNSILLKKKIDIVLTKSAAVATSNNLINKLFDKSIDFHKLSITKLKELIVYNKKPNGSSPNFNYVKMPKSLQFKIN